MATNKLQECAISGGLPPAIKAEARQEVATHFKKSIERLLESAIELPFQISAESLQQLHRIFRPYTFVVGTQRNTVTHPVAKVVQLLAHDILGHFMNGDCIEIGPDIKQGGVTKCKHACSKLSARDESRASSAEANGHDMGKYLAGRNTPMLCTRGAELCTVQAVKAVSIHSGYDISQKEWYDIFCSHGLRKARVALILPPELLMGIDTRLPDLGLSITYSGKTVSMHFECESLSYQHNADKWRDYLRRPCYDGEEFNLLFEVSHRIGPLAIIEITKCKKGARIQRAALDHLKGFVRIIDITHRPEALLDLLRSYRFCGGILEEVLARWPILYYPRESYDDLILWAMTRLDETFSKQQVITHMRTLSRTISFGGNTIRKGYEIPGENVVPLIVNLFIDVAIKRQQLTKGIGKFINELKATTTCWERAIATLRDFFATSHGTLLADLGISAQRLAVIVACKGFLNRVDEGDVTETGDGYSDDREDTLSEWVQYIPSDGMCLSRSISILRHGDDSFVSEYHAELQGDLDKAAERYPDSVREIKIDHLHAQPVLRRESFCMHGVGYTLTPHRNMSKALGPTSEDMTRIMYSGRANIARVQHKAVFACSILRQHFVTGSILRKIQKCHIGVLCSEPRGDREMYYRCQTIPHFYGTPYAVHRPVDHEGVHVNACCCECMARVPERYVYADLGGEWDLPQCAFTAARVCTLLRQSGKFFVLKLQKFTQIVNSYVQGADLLYDALQGCSFYQCESSASEWYATNCHQMPGFRYTMAASEPSGAYQPVVPTAHQPEAWAIEEKAGPREPLPYLEPEIAEATSDLPRTIIRKDEALDGVLSALRGFDSQKPGVVEGHLAPDKGIEMKDPLDAVFGIECQPPPSAPPIAEAVSESDYEPADVTADEKPSAPPEAEVHSLADSASDTETESEIDGTHSNAVQSVGTFKPHDGKALPYRLKHYDPPGDGYCGFGFLQLIMNAAVDVRRFHKAVQHLVSDNSWLLQDDVIALANSFGYTIRYPGEEHLLEKRDVLLHFDEEGRHYRFSCREDLLTLTPRDGIIFDSFDQLKKGRNPLTCRIGYLGGSMTGFHSPVVIKGNTYFDADFDRTPSTVHCGFSASFNNDRFGGGGTAGVVAKYAPYMGSCWRKDFVGWVEYNDVQHWVSGPNDQSLYAPRANNRLQVVPGTSIWRWDMEKTLAKHARVQGCFFMGLPKHLLVRGSPYITLAPGKISSGVPPEIDEPPVSEVQSVSGIGEDFHQSGPIDDVIVESQSEEGSSTKDEDSVFDHSEELSDIQAAECREAVTAFLGVPPEEAHIINNKKEFGAKWAPSVSLRINKRKKVTIKNLEIPLGRDGRVVDVRGSLPECLDTITANDNCLFRIPASEDSAHLRLVVAHQRAGGRNVAVFDGLCRGCATDNAIVTGENAFKPTKVELELTDQQFAAIKECGLKMLAVKGTEPFAKSHIAAMTNFSKLKNRKLNFEVMNGVPGSGKTSILQKNVAKALYVTPVASLKESNRAKGVNSTTFAPFIARGREEGVVVLDEYCLHHPVTLLFACQYAKRVILIGDPNQNTIGSNDYKPVYTIQQLLPEGIHWLRVSHTVLPEVAAWATTHLGYKTVTKNKQKGQVFIHNGTPPADKPVICFTTAVEGTHPNWRTAAKVQGLREEESHVLFDSSSKMLVKNCPGMAYVALTRATRRLHLYFANNMDIVTHGLGIFAHTCKVGALDHFVLDGVRYEYTDFSFSPSSEPRLRVQKQLELHDDDPPLEAQPLADDAADEEGHVEMQQIVGQSMHVEAPVDVLDNIEFGGVHLTNVAVGMDVEPRDQWDLLPEREYLSHAIEGCDFATAADVLHELCPTTSDHGENYQGFAHSTFPWPNNQLKIRPPMRRTELGEEEPAHRNKAHEYRVSKRFSCRQAMRGRPCSNKDTSQVIHTALHRYDGTPLLSKENDNLFYASMRRALDEIMPDHSQIDSEHVVLALAEQLKRVSDKKDPDALQVFDPYDRACLEIACFLKQQTKADDKPDSWLRTDSGGELKAGQGISAQSKSVNMMAGALVRMTEKIFQKTCEANVVFCHGKHPKYLSLEIAAEQEMEQYEGIFCCDIVQFDALRGKATDRIMRDVYNRIGTFDVGVQIMEELNQKWQLNAGDVILDVRNHMQSGRSDTLTSNTIVNALAILGNFTFRRRGRLYVQGDDSAVPCDFAEFSGHPCLAPYLKPDFGMVGELVGFLVADRLYTNPVKQSIKIMNRDFDSRGEFDQYRTGVREWLTLIDSPHCLEKNLWCAALWYGCSYQHMEALHSFVRWYAYADRDLVWRHYSRMHTKRLLV